MVGGFSCQLAGSLGGSWCSFTVIPNTVKSLDELHGLISTQIQMFIVQSQIKDQRIIKQTAYCVANGKSTLSSKYIHAECVCFLDAFLKDYNGILYECCLHREHPSKATLTLNKYTLDILGGTSNVMRFCQHH